MSTSKFEPEVYVILRNTGLPNTKIAEMLGVSEAAVRRGLKRAGYLPPEQSRLRELFAELGDILERPAL